MASRCHLTRQHDPPLAAPPLMPSKALFQGFSIGSISVALQPQEPAAGWPTQAGLGAQVFAQRQKDLF